MKKTRKFGTSAQERGRANARLLHEWINVTPLSQVPINQFGKVARSRVCELHGIPLSTVRTNLVIKDMFEQLDARISDLPACSRAQANTTADSSDELQQLRTANTELTRKLSYVQQRLVRLQYLENFGIVVN